MIDPKEWAAANEMAKTFVSDTTGMPEDARVWTFLACTIHSFMQMPVAKRLLTAYTCAQMILNSGVKK